MTISVWGKWIFKKYLIFSDTMQTFLEISPNFHNDWRWYDSMLVYILSTCQMPILVTALAVWPSTIWAPDSKNKLSWTISYNHKTLITFRYDAPNSQVPGFNFLEFLVNVLSTGSRGESTKHTCSYVKAIAYCFCRKFSRFTFL